MDGSSSCASTFVMLPDITASPTQTSVEPWSGAQIWPKHRKIFKPSSLKLFCKTERHTKLSGSLGLIMECWSKHFIFISHKNFVMFYRLRVLFQRLSANLSSSITTFEADKLLYLLCIWLAVTVGSASTNSLEEFMPPKSSDANSYFPIALNVT